MKTTREFAEAIFQLDTIEAIEQHLRAYRTQEVNTFAALNTALVESAGPSVGLFQQRVHR